MEGAAEGCRREGGGGVGVGVGGGPGDVKLREDEMGESVDRERGLG